MRLLASIGLFTFLWSACLFAEKSDRGKDEIGKLEVKMIYGSSQSLDQGEALADEVVEILKKTKELTFSSYRILGVDRQPVWRSYENWATPVAGDRQLLMSFEPLGETKGDSLRLDLELWQARKKILKTAPNLSVGEPLYILGPPWRNGRIVISVELLSLK